MGTLSLRLDRRNGRTETQASHRAPSSRGIAKLHALVSRTSVDAGHSHGNVVGRILDLCTSPTRTTASAQSSSSTGVSHSHTCYYFGAIDADSFRCIPCAARARFERARDRRVRTRRSRMAPGPSAHDKRLATPAVFCNSRCDDCATALCLAIAWCGISSYAFVGTAWHPPREALAIACGCTTCERRGSTRRR